MGLPKDMIGFLSYKLFWLGFHVSKKNPDQFDIGK